MHCAPRWSSIDVSETERVEIERSVLLTLKIRRPEEDVPFRNFEIRWAVYLYRPVRKYGSTRVHWAKISQYFIHNRLVI